MPAARNDNRGVASCAPEHKVRREPLAASQDTRSQIDGSGGGQQRRRGPAIGAKMAHDWKAKPVWGLSAEC
jgi:hypothetical protein